MFLPLIAAATLRVEPQASCEAPFAMLGGTLLVEATVGDQKGWFFLDTGSPVSWLDKVVFSKIAGRKPTAPPDGGVEVDDFPQFQVGGAALKDVLFFNSLPFDLPAATKSAYKIKVAGVLGYDILRRLAMGIDFDARQAWFWGSTQGGTASKQFFKQNTSLESISILNQDSYPRVVATFDGRPFYLPLDLGSTFTTAQAPATDWFGPHLAFGAHQTVDAFGKNENQHLFVPDELAFGSCRYLSPLCAETSLQPPRPCVLGWTLFSPLHRVLFDLDCGVVRYRSVPQPLTGCDPLLSSFGLEAGPDRELRPVASVLGGLTHEIPLSDISTIGGVPADQFPLNPDSDWLKRADLVHSFSKVGLATIALDIVFKSKGKKDLKQPLIGADLISKVLPAPIKATDDYAGGPGIYLAMPGTKPMKLDAGRDPLPEHGESFLVSVGGMGTPAIIPIPGQSGRFTVDVPLSPLEMLSYIGGAVAGKSLVVSRTGAGTDPWSADPKNGPVSVNAADVVANPMNWIPVPLPGSKLVVYYPPGWKFPALSPAGSKRGKTSSDERGRKN